ncbi:MAG: dipeptide ABC transporter ATP-binding protein [Bacillota bacterium]|nr:dipeptide ABC transporter ATP-binding protein [Bacillota bacterium]
MGEAILKIDNLRKYYPVKRQNSFGKSEWLKAVDGISFEVYEGETLGLVGESGCGKSTTRKLLLRLEEATSGSIYFHGRDIYRMNRAELKAFRHEAQVVFQDPYASLDPKWKVGKIIGEPLQIHGIGNRKTRREKVLALMECVGLPAEYYERYAHEFSGGQRQRIGIARALALEPTLIVADEPVSALDVSIQAQILNLMKDLQKRLELTYVFISHDLSVVKHICQRVAVMYLGKIVEIADTEELFSNPLHPYTVALMNAIPLPDPTLKQQLNVLEGEVPSPINPPTGCPFHTRCPHAMDICRVQEPPVNMMQNGHQLACHLYK